MFRVAAKNTTLIPAAEKKIAAARQKLAAAKTARDAVPAKLPANVIDPEARTALLRTVVPLKEIMSHCVALPWEAITGSPPAVGVVRAGSG
ncbi:MAG: hypothetical protein ACRDOH_15615 [Streptosporangiaceae bacterium]